VVGGGAEKMLLVGCGGEEKQIGSNHIHPWSLARGLVAPVLACRGGEGKGWRSA
jgi:hypothetical protein